MIKYLITFTCLHVLRSIAILGGLGTVGRELITTRTPWDSSNEFLLAYSHPMSGCRTPNPLNCCGYSYDADLITLDYFFWTTLTFALMFILDIIRMRLKLLHPTNVSASELT